MITMIRSGDNVKCLFGDLMRLGIVVSEVRIWSGLVHWDGWSIMISSS